MRAYDLIMKKRKGAVLDDEEVRFLIEGYTSGEVPDYQMSAFAMAVYFKGMAPRELATFTDAMLNSGEVVDLSHIDKLKVDKHSTGGVGDKISLPLAPAVAACGVPVPMVSGRGLGHTGGTLDKLESIPGFRVDLDTAAYRRLVEEVGCCLIGQTAEVAPADKKLYALRDVTATVDCVPLIASSIMSKKLAEGIDGLVLDVKFGSGAFMKDKGDALTLAQTMVDIGENMQKRVVARLTNMDQPLGVMVGNALEVKESLDVLEGGGPEDIVALTVELGAEMLVLGKVAKDTEAGRDKIRAVLSDGSAFAKFEEIVAAQEGDVGSLRARDKLPVAPERYTVKAARSGVVGGIDAESVGIASMVLGGGRAKFDDDVDPRVGVEVHQRIGDEVKSGDTLFVVHHDTKGLESCVERLERSIAWGDAAAPETSAPALFAERIEGGIT